MSKLHKILNDRPEELESTFYKSPIDGANVAVIKRKDNGHGVSIAFYNRMSREKLEKRLSVILDE